MKFWDSSAIVPLCLNEPTSEAVKNMEGDVVPLVPVLPMAEFEEPTELRSPLPAALRRAAIVRGVAFGPQRFRGKAQPPQSAGPKSGLSIFGILASLLTLAQSAVSALMNSEKCPGGVVHGRDLDPFRVQPVDDVARGPAGARIPYYLEFHRDALLFGQVDYRNEPPAYQDNSSPSRQWFPIHS